MTLFLLLNILVETLVFFIIHIYVQANATDFSSIPISITYVFDVFDVCNVNAVFTDIPLSVSIAMTKT